MRGGGQNSSSELSSTLPTLSESVLHQGIQNYTHTKSGTVHSLIGSTGSDYISFTATANYYENDTWQLNGNPITVNFANGLPLVVGGIITGDFVWGKLDGNVLTLSHNQINSNGNILDNWYFVNPINQRGLVTYSNGYGIDRWKYGQTVNLVEDGVQIYRDTVTNNPNFNQPIENSKQYIGKTLTLSVLAKTDKNGSFTLWCATSGSPYFGEVYINASSDFVLYSTTFVVTNTTNPDILYPSVQDAGAVRNNNPTIGDNCIIKAAKLELGSHQTLAHKDSAGNWVLNDPPPNYEEELAKCQRFYFYGNIENAALTVGPNTNNCYINVHLPVPLRIKPSLGSATTAKPYLVNGNTSLNDATLTVGSGKYDNGVEIRITPVNNQLYYLSGNIELNANL